MVFLTEAPSAVPQEGGGAEFVFQPYYHSARVPAEMSIFVFQNDKLRLVFTPSVTERREKAAAKLASFPETKY